MAPYLYNTEEDMVRLVDALVGLTTAADGAGGEDGGSAASKL